VQASDRQVGRVGRSRRRAAPTAASTTGAPAVVRGFARKCSAPRALRRHDFERGLATRPPIRDSRPVPIGVDGPPDYYNRGEQFRAVWFDLQSARDQPDLQRAFSTVRNVLDSEVARTLSDVGIPAHRERLIDDPAYGSDAHGGREREARLRGGDAESDIAPAPGLGVA